MKFKKAIITTLAFTSLSALANKDQDAIATLALQSANFTLDQAIEKVKADYKADIIEFEIDEYENNTAYEIELFNTETHEKHKIKLSLNDGSVLKIEKKNLKVLGVNRLDENEKIAINNLRSSNFDLSKTVIELKQKFKGNILEFELDNEKGVTFYKFKLMGEQGLTRVIVDVQTGNLIPVINH